MRLFKKSDLLELLAGEVVERPVEKLELVQDSLVGSDRWSKHYLVVFKCHLPDKVEYYCVEYHRGATEMQDERPFEDEGDLIQCREVRPVEKVVIHYEEVDPPNPMRSPTLRPRIQTADDTLPAGEPPDDGPA